MNEQDRRDRETAAVIHAALASEAQRLEDLRSAYATLQDLAERYSGLHSRSSNAVASRAQRAADLTRDIVNMLERN